MILSFAISNLSASKGAQIASLLAERVRVLTDAQVARTWFANNKNPFRSARETLARLKAKRDVTLTRVMSHREIRLTSPVLIWEAGDSLPNFDRIAWQLDRRWSESPVSTLVAVATKRTAILTGGRMGGRSPRAREVTHDIHVSSLFLKFYSENPELANSWIHEDALDREHPEIYGDTIPDAIVTGPRLIEFGGRYSAGKLLATHLDRAKHELTYEIW